MKPSTRTSLIASLTATAGIISGVQFAELTDESLLRTTEIIEKQNQAALEIGEYEQILPSGEKPQDAKRTELVKDFPQNVRVDVYDGPEGKGYTIIENLPDGTEVAISFGPEAAQRSYVKSPNTDIASSTKLEK